MEVVVEDKQLSLAIGKKGQNVRLAAKLTGWRIDIKSEEEKRKEVEEQFGALGGEDAGAESEPGGEEPPAENAGAETEPGGDEPGGDEPSADAPSVEVASAEESSAGESPTDEPAAEAEETTPEMETEKS
jgi:hypothetical protein